ncbi:Putative MFS transporter superfamily [Septoria linicola]|uniref:MFS transporter superfamily n=1 Tax=Septoria linicola TaxID=215465 RepID=A0A9Q9B9K3_9PEZI|nr:putative MFS transporter superfamily [Septoria linicola]USW59556.1 Putative MFS transporter superfamily [Septoria linicola]
MSLSNDRDETCQPDEEESSRRPLLRDSNDESTTSDADKELSLPKLLALTCINGGLQVFFSTVMANLAPYLQRLGLSKSATAAIIISLPLSGSFIGPLSGAISDQYIRTRFGRRRPMILLGTLLAVTFMGLLAWTENFANGDTARAFAVIFTLLLSISVQPIQAGVRALMVDIAPAAQQSRASAYASRIQGSLSIFSFFASSLTLNNLPGLGRLTQFQCLTCLNFITLGGTVLITCVFIQERDSRRIRLEGADADGKKQNVGDFFKQLWHTARTLPEMVEQACKVQFASWWAWFPFTYYNTTYIGELVDVAEQAQSDGDQLAQAGSVASLCFAAVGFFFVLVLPVALPYVSRLVRRNRQSHGSSDTSERDLIWLWLFTQPVLGLLLVLTLAAAYQWQGTVLVAIAGLPWAVTQWVPWAVIGYETSKLGLSGQDQSEDSKSGAILGVHNMAISLPQVLSGAVSSATYKIAEEAGSQVPTAWVLASSGIAAFVASFLARRMLQ